MRMKLAVIVLLHIIGAAAAYGEAYQYEPRGKRDPFVPLYGQGKTSAALALEDAVTIDDVRLEGIVTDAKGRMMAILNGEIMKQGSKIGLVQVLKVDKGSAALLIGGKEYTLQLFEEGGSKGE